MKTKFFVLLVTAGAMLSSTVSFGASLRVRGLIWAQPEAKPVVEQIDYFIGLAQNTAQNDKKSWKGKRRELGRVWVQTEKMLLKFNDIVPGYLIGDIQEKVDNIRTYLYSGDQTALKQTLKDLHDEVHSD